MYISLFSGPYTRLMKGQGLGHSSSDLGTGQGTGERSKES